MDTVANLPAADRAELFRETGERMELSGALVEKDFWVCWTLGQLFEMESIRDMLMFKGGTSLSKVFKLVDRFSEDIDLAIDYAPLGFVGERDPVVEMSRTHRGKYSRWARYDLAIPGTLALVPPAARHTELRRDYDAMARMIFGEPPPLEEILDELARLEARINEPARRPPEFAAR